MYNNLKDKHFLVEHINCKNNYRRSTLIIALAIFTISSIYSCKKFIDVAPPITSITGTSVYSTDGTASSVLTGIYASMSSGATATAGSVPSVSMFPGLSSDELSLWNGVTNVTALAYYKNALSGAQVGKGNEYWNTYYNFIFKCNDAIAGLSASNSLTPSVKQQLTGEAKFLRAYFYFYLTNLYGDVPLAITNDYKVNSTLARSSSSQVYQQIITDLHDAQNLLSPKFLDASLLNTTTDRVRPTKWAATALLARTYLYTKNWVGADSAATALISNSAIFNLSSLNSTFLRSSLGNSEAIWQLQPVTAAPLTNTGDAQAFVIPPTGPGTVGNFGAILSNDLIAAFESGDNRKTNWTANITIAGTTYYYPFKYKISTYYPPANPPVTEHLMMFRLGEQYLIRAEARTQLATNIAGAQSDLNSIRNRAGLPNTTAGDKTSLLAAILHERQVELFTEQGQRWLDLKRTGTVDAVMGANNVTTRKGIIWSSYEQLYPISFNDIQQNSSIKQNPGY